ncbi:MAG: EamA family transporter, partial [Pseudomonadota bacterium]
ERARAAGDGIDQGEGAALVTASLALFVFGERMSFEQWCGLILLSSAIFGLAYANIRSRALSAEERRGVRLAVLTALGTGVMIAIYTVVDAYGIRLAENPFTFLAWFFFMGGFGFPIIAYLRWRRIAVKPPIGDLAIRGVFGALIAYLSFGSIMLATRLDKVGEAAALRETSIIFATAIGVLLFKEKIDALRLLLILLIAIGAIVADFGF